MAADMLAPTWELEVAGVFLAEDYKRLVTGITVEASIDGADELVVEASAWDADTGTFRIIGETVLGIGTEVVVWMGYTGSIAALQRFRLIREEAAYPTGGHPTVTIRGYSAAHRLVESTKPRAWEGPVADSDIVRELAEEFGFTVTDASVHDTASRDAGRVKKAGTSDLEFLQQLAVACGFGPPVVRYDADQDADVLYFRATSLADQSEIATFYWNPALGGSEEEVGTCWSFAPSLSLAGVPTKVEVIGWDPTAQAPIRVVVEITEGGQESTVYTGGEVGKVSAAVKSGSQLQVRVLGDAGRESSKVEVISAQHVSTTEDAVAWAKRWLTTRNQAFMVARATVIGYERLWVGQIHQFEGLADTHRGKWGILTCTHKIGDEGYSCDLDLERVLEEAQAATEAS